MEAISPTSITRILCEAAQRDHPETPNKNRHTSSLLEISYPSRPIRRALATQPSPRDKPPNKWRVQAVLPLIYSLQATDRRRQRSIISLAYRRFRAVRRRVTMQWRRSKDTDLGLSSLPTMSVTHHRKMLQIIILEVVACLHLPATVEE